MSFRRLNDVNVGPEPHWLAIDFFDFRVEISGAETIINLTTPTDSPYTTLMSFVCPLFLRKLGIMSADLRVPLFRRPGFFRWAAGLLVITSVLVIAESANASCGDYLHGFNHSSVVVEHPNAEDLPAHDAPSKGPYCDGPRCHRAPFLPIDRPLSDTQILKAKELLVWEKTRFVITDVWYRLERDRGVLPNPPDSDRLDRPPRI